jgi:hypothetical protein
LGVQGSEEGEGGEYRRETYRFEAGHEFSGIELDENFDAEIRTQKLGILREGVKKLLTAEAAENGRRGRRGKQEDYRTAAEDTREAQKMRRKK